MTTKHLMKRIFLYIVLSLTTLAQSCQKDDGLRSEIDDLRDRVEALEKQLGTINAEIRNIHALLSEGVLVVGVTPGQNKDYTIELSDGTVIEIIVGKEHPALVPTMSIGPDGNWTYSLNGTTFLPLLDAQGNPIPARSDDGVTPQLKIDDQGYWLISYDGGPYTQLLQDGKPVSAAGSKVSYSIFEDVKYNPQSGMLEIELRDGQKLTFPVMDSFSMTITPTGRQNFLLGETRQFEVSAQGISELKIEAPEGWRARIDQTTLTVTAPSTTNQEQDAQIDITIYSQEGYRRIVHFEVHLKSTAYDPAGTKAWNDFLANNDQNLLVDYSYAGYKRGEVAPPDVYSLNHEIVNIRTYGAIADDGRSDREAFVAAAAAAVEIAKTGKTAIIYFPNGRYDLKESAEVDGTQTELLIRSSNIVLKGESREGSVIVMNSYNEPPAGSDNPPSLVSLKNWSGLSALTDVTSDARRGAFSVEVASAARITKNMWVCLTLSNNDPELIAQELAPKQFHASMTSLSDAPDPIDPIKGGGVKVLEYHQVKSVSGNTVTFYEPIMHAVESRWGWKLFDFKNHYENVGVEDLTFEGNCIPAFSHHGDDGQNVGWLNDSGYKLLTLMRLTDSWVRRVTFRNVSEGLTFAHCANTSAYDIRVEGRRGHSAVRAQASSRVFIGKVSDLADVVDAQGQIVAAGAGQWHTSGVSQTSIGTVLWQLDWGAGSCFEAHASQPRATLVDNCSGGLVVGRMGGATSQLPNHLGGLTLWNFNAKAAPANYVWWSNSDSWIKCLPPIVVGYHGAATIFDAGQTELDESHGTAVNPGSLYEAQLRNRLGYVPGWLNALK